MTTTNGIHIIADLYGCDFSCYVEKHSLADIINKIESVIGANGFTVLGTLSHDFGKNAFSVVCMLSESHVSIHTWPESGYVSFDIHTCNYRVDNTGGSERMFEEFVEMFAPKRIKKEMLVRAIGGA